MANDEVTGPGESVRVLRNLAGLTLDQVAELAGTSASYLSRVETGVETASKLYLGRVTSVIADHMKGAA